MSKIHYFQRYSSVENTVTNNTLQLFSRIYQYSPIKASLLLSTLMDNPIDIGIEITQQVRDGNSVPDATIIQRSFKVLIESKVDSGIDSTQLLKHVSGFGNEEMKVLLLLTKTKINDTDETRLKDDIKKSPHPSVIFKNITYEEICSSCEGLFEKYEDQMFELVSDYKEYCNDFGLFDQTRKMLRIVPCSDSVKINKKYGIYFQPSDRGYSNHRFIGIYAEKTVQAIWEIDSVFDVNLIEGNLQKKIIGGRETDDYDKNIIEIIEDAKTECGYNVAEGHRFFCGLPKCTDFKKASKHGIMRARFLNLEDYVSDIDTLTVEGIARKLQSEKWE